MQSLISSAPPFARFALPVSACPLLRQAAHSEAIRHHDRAHERHEHLRLHFDDILVREEDNRAELACHGIDRVVLFEKGRTIAMAAMQRKAKQFC